MQKIVFGPSRLLLLAWVLLSLSLAFMIYEAGANLGASLLFCAAAAGCLYELLNPAPLITLDEEGLYDRKMGVGVVPWEDIRAVHLKRVALVDFVHVELKGCEKYRQKRPKSRRWTSEWSVASGIPEFHLATPVTAAHPQVVLEAIQRKREEHHARINTAL